MKTHALALAVAAGLSALPAYTGAASAAAVTKSQAPCVASESACVQWTDTDATIPLVRKIVFSAPSAGTATVLFHGTMNCFSTNTDARTTVDLQSQILSTNTAPNFIHAGGLRHEATLELSTVSFFPEVTFNLASVRVFDIPAAGSHTYFFKIGKSQMDPSTGCAVYNATFTVQFIP